MNEYLQTNFPNILACGNVTDPGLPVQAGVHQARYCALNALYGRFWRLPVDCRSIPRIVFTHPQVARVGLTENEATDEGLNPKCTTCDLKALDASTAGDDTQGFVKVLTDERGERILGVTVVGSRAGDMIGRFALAMRRGLDPPKVLGTGPIHPPPVGGLTAEGGVAACRAPCQHIDVVPAEPGGFLLGARATASLARGQDDGRTEDIDEGRQMKVDG